MMKVFLVALSLLIMFSGFMPGPLASVQKAQATAQTSLTNGNFEATAVDGKIPGWTYIGDTVTGITYGISSEQRAAGENSLKLEDTLQTATVGLISDPFPVLAGETYAAVADLYLATGTVASISLRYYDSTNNQLNTTEIVTHNEPGKGFPTGKWEKTSTPETVAPTDVSYAKVVLSVSRYGVATAYFDNANIALIPQAPTNPTPSPTALTNGGFEQTAVDGKIPGWTTIGALTTGIAYGISTEQKAAGQYSLKLEDSVTTATVGLTSDKLNVIPGQTYVGTSELYIDSGNVASISMNFYDKDNKKLNTTEIVMHNEPGKGFPIQKWEKTYTPKYIAPDTASYATLTLSVSRYGVATAYFDNASIDVVEPLDPPSINIRNPGFEKPIEFGKIQNWTSMSNPTGAEHYYELNTDLVFSGNQSLKIYDKVRDKAVSLLSDEFIVTPGDFYTATGKLYLKNDSTASMSIKFYSAQGNELSAGAVEMHNETAKGFPVEQWTDIYTRKATAPAGATVGKIYIYTTNYAIGEAYFDDMSVIHVPDNNPAELTLTAPTQLSAGETFTVSLDAKKLKGLNQLQANLHFNEHLIEYIGLTAVDSYAATGASVQAKASAGKLELTATTAASLNADTGIVELQFKVISDKAQAWLVLSKETLMNGMYKPYADTTVLMNIGSISGGILGNFTFGQPENLGAPINDTVGLFDGITGVEDGMKVMYTTVKGTTPVFHVINLEEHSVVRSLLMPHAGDVWSHTVTPNGDVYIAAGGELWMYSPATKQIQKVYAHATESVFWGLDHDENGNVYIATGPTGRILKYDPATSTDHDYGRLMGITGQEYVRSIAYSNGYVYGGTNLAKIYKINVQTGEKIEIVAPADAEGYVYDLDIVDDRLLIARFDVTQVRYVYDLPNEKWLDVRINNSLTGLTTTKTSLDGKIYMPVNGYITSFDVNTHELEPIYRFGTGFRGANWIDVDDPELPGTSLVTMSFAGGYVFFNPQTGKIKVIDNFLPPTPSITHVFREGSNGKMYITGMQASKASEYDVFTNQNRLINLGQAGAVIPYEEKVYFGVYPGAVFEEYTPASGSEPVKLFNIGEDQDRPIAAVAAEGKIFIGNIPDYRILGGAMMVYDPSAKSYKVYRNIVKDQSIMSLTYHNGKIYGATSVNGGIGSETTAKEAKIFVWDIATEQKIAEFGLEIPGLYTPPAIGGLTIGPDGLLWGGVNGIVFAIDPESFAIVKYKNLYPGDGPWAQWGAFKGVWHDGILYMHLGRRLTAIDPITLNHKSIDTADTVAIGEDGHLYYSPHTDRSLMNKVTIQNNNHPGKLNVSAPLAVKLDEEFEVALYANQVVNLNSLVAQLSFDQEAVSFINAETVGLFSEESAAVNVNSEAGGITLIAKLAEGTSLPKDAKVAVLRFKAIKAAKAVEVTLLDESTTAFASSAQAYAMNQDKQITIAINEDEQPVQPEQPEQPTSPSVPVTPAPSLPAGEGVLVVTADELKSDNEGKVVLAMDPSINVVRLPITTPEILGNRSLSLLSDDIEVEIPADALQQLVQFVQQENLEGAYLEFTRAALDAEEFRATVQAASTKHAAIITQTGEVYNLGLVVVAKDGTRFSLADLDTSIKVTIKIDDSANRDLVGVYTIAEDGTLTYVKGKLVGNLLTVELNGFSQFGVFEYDKSFDDLPSSHWAYNAIKKLVAKQIAHGISDSVFNPNGSITRAELTALIVRTMGLNRTGSSEFADVKANDWFAPYVSMAYEAGIISGKSETRFAPNQSISREEMAAIIVRAYEYQLGRTIEVSAVAGFKDQAQISSWASDYVNKAFEAGLVNGRGDHNFAPSGQLSRAEAIQALLNFMTKVEE